ncbi:MAG: TetR/AcrR family transcriptional regulator [Phormidesmis sp.]
MSSSSIDTQTQILDTAERLFSEQGFGATSLRSIIREADVNIGAINYHFGSKDALISAAIDRMAQPIVKASIERVKQCEAEGLPMTVETILRAFFGPALEIICLEEENRGLVRARFMGQCRTEPAIEIVAAKAFEESTQFFIKALQRALPDQSESEIQWKLDLAVSMLIRILCAAYQPGSVLEGNSEKDVERALSRLVSFAAAGMKA